MAKLEMQIEGMSCGHCLRAVREALENVAGPAVESVQIGRAVVGLEGGRTADDLVAAVEGAGYNVAFSREVA
jgi:copper chaperone